jgi:hypothetical protein
VVDCSAYATLKHEVIEANADLKDLGFDLGGRYESEALAQVRESTEQLALALESACRDYNACVKDANGYVDFKNQALARLSKHLNLATEQQGRVSAAVGDRIWSNALPEAAARRLVLSYSVSSRQGASFVAHTSGQALTSGTELRIGMQTNRDAYIYVVLLTQTCHPQALFPNPNFAGANPLRGGTRLAIPPPDVALMLDRQLGTEHLEFIASLAPLTQLESSLEAVAVSKPRKTTSNAATTTDVRVNLLTDVGKLICAPRLTSQLRIGGTRVDCGDALGRGLVLAKREGAVADTQVAATPNDDVVVLQHEILHR